MMRYSWIRDPALMEHLHNEKLSGWIQTDAALSQAKNPTNRLVVNVGTISLRPDRKEPKVADKKINC
jgi:hypothetical protein